ncbi:MAG TPA: bifunctional fructose-bisphosphatase/inositol-phosphate phosphatase [Methanospirillum sp.]|jgi:myo-inositol-1(or 4)-monophosphatase|uniref:bifunctional fructose-bisphosphatase/inositol-phosphate phosphatase n=1 Tax=Methanospirillum sp. TaxID=45200 RepID=UPI001BD2F601|nr:bifunctional fructose-bisphosphatase/inositol-phosphate phosphatase [Methanospirillum sp.]HPY59490.1 bifunctional fructose-bisphosphatase/inositol-phosphate phosphatase [Methanospirillum sp.]HQC00036.1 bifunctional fructose-bisphosphatase/inositol-phosphate phosphatase [Methanospirillum sp.]
MDFYQTSNSIFTEIRRAVTPLVGTPEAGVTTGTGADGTPTKYIDKIAEDIAISHIKEENICHLLISEEAGKVEMGGDSGTIFLDPVDGTYNALMNIPFFAVSLAYVKNEKLVEGFVGNLSNGDVFSAKFGKGSFMNGVPIRVSDTKELQASAMSIYGKHFQYDRVVHLIRKIRRFRQFGASALELSYVGAGKIDGFVDLRRTLRATDAAAGILILEEAGGIVSDRDGNKLTLPDEVSIGNCLVGTNAHLHKKVIEYLR